MPSVHRASTSARPTDRPCQYLHVPLWPHLGSGPRLSSSVRRLSQALQVTRAALVGPCRAMHSHGSTINEVCLSAIPPPGNSSRTASFRPAPSQRAITLVEGRTLVTCHHTLSLFRGLFYLILSLSCAFPQVTVAFVPASYCKSTSTVIWSHRKQPECKKIAFCPYLYMHACVCQFWLATRLTRVSRVS